MNVDKNMSDMKKNEASDSEILLPIKQNNLKQSV